MHCTNCGNRLPNGANFCTSCGQNVTNNLGRDTQSLFNNADKSIKNKNSNTPIILIIVIAAITAFAYYIYTEIERDRKAQEIIRYIYGDGTEGQPTSETIPDVIPENKSDNTIYCIGIDCPSCNGKGQGWFLPPGVSDPMEMVYGLCSNCCGKGRVCQQCGQIYYTEGQSCALNQQSVSIDQSDISTGGESSSPEACYTCNGKKRCPICAGIGYKRAGGERYDCSACNGSGICYHCYGSGLK